MPIDYLVESEKYRPRVIETLLIGEAPPPSGKTYFYVPRDVQTARPIENNATLPATIFNHYFRTLPRSLDEYHEFLLKLCEGGVFLADICDEPIKVRGSDAGLNRIVCEIPRLKDKLKTRGLIVAEEAMVFLLARQGYQTQIRREFPQARRFTWKQFRTNRAVILKASSRAEGQ